MPNAPHHGRAGQPAGADTLPLHGGDVARTDQRVRATSRSLALAQQAFAQKSYDDVSIDALAAAADSCSPQPQLLPAESRRVLDEMGAVEYDLPPSAFTNGDRFTVVVARGGDEAAVQVFGCVIVRPVAQN